MSHQFKLKLAAIGLILCGATLTLQGCQSNLEDITTQTHGSQAGDGYTYGTGPDKTRPYPQTSPVNINNVGGATPKAEALSRGGNKDYTVLGQNYMVWTDCTSYQEVGTASWYGPGFHGNKTSNGELYDQKGFTAAHKNLPLPSYVKVTNLENGKAVVVRVNDRGPFHGSRIIDLSEGAAKAISMTDKGTAKVKLEYINIRGASNVTTEGGSGQGGILAGGAGGVAGAIIGAVLDKTGASNTIQNIQDIKDIAQAIESGKKPSASEIRDAAGALSEVASDLEKAANTTNQTLSSSQSQAGALAGVGGAAGAGSQTLASATSKPSVTTTTTTSTNYQGSGINKTISSTAVSNTTNVSNIPNATTNVGNLPSATTNYQLAASQVLTALAAGQPYVQFFTSSSQWRASQIQAKVQKQTPYPVLVLAEDNLYRVMVGPIKSEDLSTMVEYFKQLGYSDAFVKHIE